jgi:hypothetical protein
MPREMVLFKISTTDILPISQWPEQLLGFKLIIYKPSLMSLSQFGTSPLVNLLWYLATINRFCILVLLDKETVVHYSYITPRMFRFLFMEKCDKQIGPCATNIDYQKRGIFTEVLKLIPAYYANKSNSIWTYTTITNSASRKAFERAGYEFVSHAKMNLITKIVRLVDRL